MAMTSMDEEAVFNASPKGSLSDCDYAVETLYVQKTVYRALFFP